MDGGKCTGVQLRCLLLSFFLGRCQQGDEIRRMRKCHRADNSDST